MDCEGLMDIAAYDRSASTDLELLACPSINLSFSLDVQCVPFGIILVMGHSAYASIITMQVMDFLVVT